MTAQLEFAVKTVRALSPHDQLELLQVLSRELQEAYDFVENNAAFWMPRALESKLRDVPVILHLSTLVLNFWPADETADDLNLFIASQRQADREQAQ
ncbi:MAG: hypothetical protein HY741_06530 [Chloroflexi bacterium]|nr:hypothetical protein [Chloroflexota bacterium]